MYKMRRTRKACMCVFISAILLTTGIISKATNCDVLLSADEVMPEDLYDVDFNQALNKNLNKADILVLGNFEFQDVSVPVRINTDDNQTSRSALSDDSIDNTLPLENRVNDDKIKMIVVSENEVEKQSAVDRAPAIRNATDNGYVVFFDVQRYEDINRITKDIYEQYESTYGVLSVDESAKEIRFAEPNPDLAYFFVTKSKDDYIEFHFVFSDIKDNEKAMERSMLEHAYANRNMRLYVSNEEEYLATKKAERVRSGDKTLVDAKGFRNPVLNGVTFYGDWKCSRYYSVYTYEYHHQNNHPDITHRTTVTTAELMSHDLVGGRRLWAQVSEIDLKVNNTTSSDRFFANRNVWWWCEESSNNASLKTYGPANAPKSATYTYGINGELNGGVSGSTDGASATAGIKIGASFSKSMEVSDVDYYTNAFDLDYSTSGTTFNVYFGNRGSLYAQNHSVHTTVTFFSQSSSINGFTFYNKLKHQSSNLWFGTWGSWTDADPVEWSYTYLYRQSGSASDYYFK